MISDPASDPVATMVLGHGAGGGAETRDLAVLAARCPALGITVIRVEQPWFVAGRRTAAPPAQLDAAWLAVVGGLRDDTPLVLGGRSAGARVACRTAARLEAAAVVALAFPLHPPGRPERSRLDELRSVRVPVLVMQGERDSFGRPEEFPRGYDVRPVPAADHGFAVPRTAPVTQEAVLSLLSGAVADWIMSVVAVRQS